MTMTAPYGGHVSKKYTFWQKICNDRHILRNVGGISIDFNQDESTIFQTRPPREIRMSNEEKAIVREKLKRNVT